MCFNLGGNDNWQNLFQKFFRRGGNDRGYYGNSKYGYLEGFRKQEVCIRWINVYQQKEEEVENWMAGLNVCFLKLRKISVVRRGEKFRGKAIEFDFSKFKWI